MRWLTCLIYIFTPICPEKKTKLAKYVPPISVTVHSSQSIDYFCIYIYYIYIYIYIYIYTHIHTYTGIHTHTGIPKSLYWRFESNSNVPYKSPICV